jgi:hypothetical protein
MFKMFPIFLVVAIVGVGVGIFFLREKQKSPAHSTPRRQSRASRRIARIGKTSRISALTEEPTALRTGAVNKAKTGPKQNQLEQIKKVTTVT